MGTLVEKCSIFIVESETILKNILLKHCFSQEFAINKRKWEHLLIGFNLYFPGKGIIIMISTTLLNYNNLAQWNLSGIKVLQHIR